MLSFKKNGGTFSSYSQEAMECVEDHLLHDQEGLGVKEEADYGHEFDDEEREIAQKIYEQFHVISSPSSSFKEFGTWLWHAGI